MDFFIPIITFLAGVGLGFAGYRHYMRRNPDQLEAVAKRLKAAGKAIESRL